MTSDGASGTLARRRSSVLVAVPTVNLWHMTHAMLTSLAAVHDDFDLLFIDDFSADGTSSMLASRQVFFLRPPVPYGLTYLWNMAYHYWRDHGYRYLFIANNDILLPDGVITKLVQGLSSGYPQGKHTGRCHLITPLSTVKGKGHLGRAEGIEVMEHLDADATEFVNNPMNYMRVQELLNQLTHSIIGQRRQFTSFFFGVSRALTEVELSSGNLFSPTSRAIGQEAGLGQRMWARGLNACLHPGAFVYHFRKRHGLAHSTVPWENLHLDSGSACPCLNISMPLVHAVAQQLSFGSSEALHVSEQPLNNTQ